MSECVGASLTVLAEQAEEARAHFQGIYGDYFPDEEYPEGALFVFHFHYVRNGELQFTPELAMAGIAYTVSWESAFEFEEGNEYLRFSPSGRPITKRVFKSDRSLPVESLIARLDNLEELEKYILAHHALITPAPLDKWQIAYGKKAVLNHLISGESPDPNIS